MITSTTTSSGLAQYFAHFRENVIGYDEHFDTAFGTQPLIYADWTASGRQYGPIEELLAREIAP